MRSFSRHLRPLQAEDSRAPFLGKVILLVILGLIGYWIYSSPLKASIGLGALAALVGGEMIIEARRIARIRRERDDTICDFRCSFDVRKVDPWIIRATYEAFGRWFDAKLVHFPLRASDSIRNDLRIDPEDVENLVHEVAQRAGYDIAECENNPLFGKVETVGDFVMFFTRQPETRQAEQGGTGQPATRPESKSEGNPKPQLESEGRSR
jgi:hypothetical protein